MHRQALTLQALREASKVDQNKGASNEPSLGNLGGPHRHAGAKGIKRCDPTKRRVDHSAEQPLAKHRQASTAHQSSRHRFSSCADANLCTASFSLPASIQGAQNGHPRGKAEIKEEIFLNPDGLSHCSSPAPHEAKGNRKTSSGQTQQSDVSHKRPRTKRASVRGTKHRTEEQLVQPAPRASLRMQEYIRLGVIIDIQVPQMNNAVPSHSPPMFSALLAPSARTCKPWSSFDKIPFVS